MTLLDAALDYATHGCSVIPVRADGSKAPAVAWKPYQAAAADKDTLAAWFTGDTYDGLGIVTGAASGNLELLELEGRATHLLPELAQLLCDSGLADLWETVSTGWVVRSPSGGIHLLYRVEGPVHGNTKLARRPNPEDPHLVDVLIETRGEAGYFVTAPSAGRTHPTGGAWTLLAGGPAMCPTITGEQRDALHIAAATFDAMPATEPLPVASAPSTPSEGRRPGDDYNDRATWDDILTPHGWTKTKRIGAGLGWTRPGKHARDGISATTGTSADGVDRLYVFSSSTEFDTERPYSKFAAYAVLEHHGDLSAAAKALRAAGYGDQARPARGDGILTLVGGPPPAQPPSHGEQTPGRARPRLDVGNNAAAAEWLRTNVGTGPLSGMFLRGLDIVHTPRVGEDGYIALVKPPPGGPAVDDDGPAQVRVVKKSTLASRIQYAYDCYKLIKRDGEFIETPAIFPVDAARVAADVPDELTGLRPLAGVIHAPVLRHDGTILATPGYDPSTQLLHLPAATLELPDIPEAPTPDDVAGAVALLDEMTAGFPFVTEHDRANYYGALLTPILRAIAPAPYKLVAITAPQPGSGKTLLATCVRLIHGGVFRAEFPEDDAELRKQITSILTVTTGQVVQIDNVSGTLRSSTLAGLLTSASWGDRPLGSTEWAAAVNDRIWMVTGNNIVLGGDLVRRALWVTIDPRVPHPEERTGFAIGDLERWVLEHRGQLIHALLTMARAWHVAGQPVGPQRGSDGYSRWIEVVDGILTHAGVSGTFAHSDSEGSVVGADDDEWADFLHAVHAAMGDRSWSVRELLGQIDATPHVPGRFEPWLERPDQPIKLSSLPGDLADKAMRPSGVQGIARSLGMWLRNRQGRWAGDYTVRYVGAGHGRDRFWRVERAERHLCAVVNAQNGDSGDSGDSDSDPYAGEESTTSRVNRAEKESPESPESPEAICSICGGPNPDHATTLYCTRCLARAKADAATLDQAQRTGA